MKKKTKPVKTSRFPLVQTNHSLLARALAGTHERKQKPTRDQARLNLALETLEQIAGFRRNTAERRLAVATLAFLRHVKPSN